MEQLVLTFPDIDPVAFSLGPVKIHWYALMYLLGFALAYLLLRRRLKQEPYRSIRTPSPYSTEMVDDILLAGIAGVIIGGRLGYVLFYKPSYYLQHPGDIIRLWDGGMSFHGGAIGVALAIWLYAWRTGRPFFQLTDFLLPAVPIGLAAGRVGNFINGELWGRPAPDDLPWAMIFPNAGGVPRHPSQLYQMALEGLLLFVLLWWFASRNRFRGEVSAFFLVGYGVFRFIGEFYREPDSFLGLLSLGLSMGQWLSVPMVVGGIGLWIWARSRRIDDTVQPEEADAVETSEEVVETDVEGTDKSGEAVDKDAENVVSTTASGATAVARDEADQTAADPEDNVVLTKDSTARAESPVEPRHAAKPDSPEDGRGASE